MFSHPNPSFIGQIRMFNHVKPQLFTMFNAWLTPYVLVTSDMDYGCFMVFSMSYQPPTPIGPRCRSGHSTGFGFRHQCAIAAVARNVTGRLLALNDLEPNGSSGTSHIQWENCWFPVNLPTNPLNHWWLSHPSEKHESQLGLFFPIYGKIENVPNHQPGKKGFSRGQTGSTGWLSPYILEMVVDMCFTSKVNHL